VELRVIEGGRAAAEGGERRLDVAAVRIEAARRLRESGCEAARVRALLVGQPMPLAFRYLQLQIGFAADALATLAVIPADFCHDRYWPSLHAATGTEPA
jgi:hypothetical protein